jgi:ATP/ADP translocase
MPPRPEPIDRPEYRSRPELQATRSFPHFRTVGEPPKGRLERFLSHFADVRAGEGVGVLLLSLAVFLLLFAYYLVKPARDALILTEGGAYVKSYLSAAQAALLTLLIPLYSLISTRIVRIKLLTGLLAFFIYKQGVL